MSNKCHCNMQFHTNLSFSELEITFTSHFMYAGHTYEYLQNISKKTYIHRYSRGSHQILPSLICKIKSNLVLVLCKHLLWPYL